jgi:hypothetical protein
MTTSMVTRAHATQSGANTVIDLGAATGGLAGEAVLDTRDFLFG